MKLLHNFEFTGSFTNVILKLREIWTFSKGHIWYFMVGPARNFKVTASNMEYTIIPYSILDGSDMYIQIYGVPQPSNIEYEVYYKDDEDDEDDEYDEYKGGRQQRQ